MPRKEFTLIIVKMQRFAINSDVHFFCRFYYNRHESRNSAQLTEKISFFKDW